MPGKSSASQDYIPTVYTGELIPKDLVAFLTDIEFSMKRDNIPDTQPDINLSCEHLKTNARVSGTYSCVSVRKLYIHTK